ncbi:MAG: metal ABC transporter permease [Chloroflexi bacterium]|nr:metal ABC transporter permease [Chloroflexota bacterium]
MSPLDFFKYEFFTRGLLAAGLVGGLCGLVGVFIVLRRMSYIGHGLSHAVFGGAVVSYVLNLNFYLGAGLWGFISALLISATARKRQIAADAAIGIVTTASFAIGVALISRTRRFTKNFEAALFGNILGVTDADVIAVLAVSIVAVLMIALLYKRLLFMTFDPEVARFYGVNTTLLEAGFSLLLAATIIASMQVMGVTLIAAAIVIPAIVARLLTDSFSTMLWLSTVIGVLTGLAGVFSSVVFDVSSGATIVLVSALLFVLVLGGTMQVRRRSRQRATALHASRQPSRAASIAGLFD